MSLERVFNPRTVAVVGDKKGQGFFWLKSLKTFQGRVYSVQIDPREIPEIEALGFPNYQSLIDIPEPVDYVICSVPRGAAPKVVRDCIQKGVGGVTLFTSAFAETGTEEGRQAQELIARIAREAGLTLIGPNCMGIFNPRIGLRFNVDQYHGDAGRVGFISQSGTHLNHMSTVGPLYGVKLAKGVSYGNAIVLDSVDYLEFLARDPEVEVIGMYIEGLREAGRFFRCLRQVTPLKPVVLWRGGETGDGRRAAFSHTAQLAHSPQGWLALLRQTGAIPVQNLEEMLDTLHALLHLKPPFGERMGIIALSGGQSVVVSDAFARAGLQVPRLTSASYGELATFFHVIGGSYQNPFDVSWQLPIENLERILGILEQDGNVDNVAVEVSGAFLARRWEARPEFVDKLLAVLSDFQRRFSKPLLTMMPPVHHEALTIEARSRFNQAGIANFPSFDRSARALRRALDYYNFRRRVGG